MNYTMIQGYLHTPDEYETPILNGTGEMLDKALAGLLEEADQLEHEPPVPNHDIQEKAFGEIMDKKYQTSDITRLR